MVGNILTMSVELAKNIESGVQILNCNGILNTNNEIGVIWYSYIYQR